MFDEYAERADRPTAEVRDSMGRSPQEGPADPLAEGPSPDEPPVFVPLGEETDGGAPSMLTADFNGIRFLLALRDEQTPIKYAQARGEYFRVPAAVLRADHDLPEGDAA
ncbi:hypothetical protein [Streptomyces sp. NPDC052225]|uniref:hypothetical protein n=1 Tax=Streptomyces sp. NPDC052225 TaxID=3154949 RepID=UPI00343B62B5